MVVVQMMAGSVVHLVLILQCLYAAHQADQ